MTSSIMNGPLSLDTTLRNALPVETAVRPADDTLSPEYREKVKVAAEKFEGFFIGQMLRQMRQSTREMAGEDSVYNSRVNQDMLDMADTSLADSLAGQRAFGIADAILRQLLPTSAAPLKEAARPAASTD